MEKELRFILKEEVGLSGIQINNPQFTLIALKAVRVGVASGSYERSLGSGIRRGALFRVYTLFYPVGRLWEQRQRASRPIKY